MQSFGTWPAVVLVLCGMWCTPSFAADPGVPDFSGMLSQRVADSAVLRGTYIKLSPTARSIFGGISELSERLSRMPTYREFMEYLLKQSAAISEEDFLTLYWLFGTAQKPHFSGSELSATVQDWDVSIRSLDLRYEVTTTGGIRDGQKRTVRFLIYGMKMLLDETVSTVKKGKESTRQIQSYDGETYRQVRGDGRETIDKWNTGHNIMGRIQPLDTCARFYDPQNPLCLDGVLNVRRRFDDEEGFQDFVADAFVYENTEMFNGVECVCVGNLYKACYLSAKQGFALIGFRDNEYDFNSAKGRVIKDDRYVEQNCEDIFLAADAIMIPRRIIHLIVRGKETEMCEARITNCEINGAIDAAAFKDVIPSGALVTTPTNPVAFHLSPPEGIEKSLAQSLQQNPAGRWFAFLNVLAACILGFAIAIRLRRSRMVKS